MIIVRVVFLFRTVTLIVGFLFCQLSKDFFHQIIFELVSFTFEMLFGLTSSCFQLLICGLQNLYFILSN